VPALGGSTGLGLVVVPDREAAAPRLVVSGANQEHGYVTAEVGGPTGLSIGDRVRILPNHACATAEMHAEMVLVDSERILGRVSRPRGW